MKSNYNQIRNINHEVDKIFKESYSVINNQVETAINDILTDTKGEKALMQIIIERRNNMNVNPHVIDGFIYQKIMEKSNNEIKEELFINLPNGVISLESLGQLNYQPLQDLLVNQKFQDADKLTQKYLCKLVEINTNNQKNWLYFTDIQFLPKQDLFIIDMLWRIYSKGKFGFSIQKKIWINSNKNWEKLWEKINWINKGIMKRYPNEFLWTMNAPEGHLPLFNQLRGTQTLHYLFNKIEW